MQIKTKGQEEMEVLENVWFHTVRRSMNVLRHMFSGLIISWGGDIV